MKLFCLVIIALVRKLAVVGGGMLSSNTELQLLERYSSVYTLNDQDIFDTE